MKIDYKKYNEMTNNSNEILNEVIKDVTSDGSIETMTIELKYKEGTDIEKIRESVLSNYIAIKIAEDLNMTPFELQLEIIKDDSEFKKLYQ